MVNGKCWNESKQGEMNIQLKIMLNGELGKDTCPHLILPSLQHINWRGRTSRCQDQNDWSSSSAIDLCAFSGRIEWEGEHIGPNPTCLWICWMRMLNEYVEYVERPARSSHNCRLCSFGNAFVLFDANLRIRFTSQVGGGRRSGNYGTSTNSSSHA